MNKKAQAGQILTKVLLGVLGVFAVVAVAPELYESLNDSTLVAFAPAWVITLMTLTVGFGLIFIIYRAMLGNK